jgi:hypothetical protein
MTFYSTGPRTKLRIAERNKQPFLSGYNMIQNEGDLLNVKQTINAKVPFTIATFVALPLAKTQTWPAMFPGEPTRQGIIRSLSLRSRTFLRRQ